MMKRYPAIALLEFSEMSTGILASDTMIKRAPISMLKSGTVSRGKYLVLIGGSVASVEEAFAAGCDVRPGSVLDSVLLPQVHEQVHEAVLGNRRRCDRESVGIVDTASVAAIIRCTDAAVKGAKIDVVEIRIGDNLGGRAFAIYNGIVEDVEAALEIARGTEQPLGSKIQTALIPKIDREMANRIEATTFFKDSSIKPVDGGEI
jgi:microcompartment protein CcmL/EutN